MANSHIRSTIDTFLLPPTPLETTILSQKPTNPHIIETKAIKNLHKFLLILITNLDQLILPNGSQLMDTNNFPTYHGKFTKLLSYVLKLLTKLVYQPTYTNNCLQPCHMHPSTNTLLPQFIIQPHNPLIKNINLHPHNQ